MAVVEDDLVGRAGGKHFDAPRHILHALQPMLDVAGAHAQNHRAACRRERIVHVEHAGHLQINGDVVHAVEARFKAHTVLRDLNIAREKIRVHADAIGHGGNCQSLQHTGGGILIGVHCGVAHHAAGKEGMLGLKIRVHGVEIIQMILTEVRVAAHLELQPIQPLLGDGMRADLHHHHLHALVRHLAERALQVNGVGRGER